MNVLDLFSGIGGFSLGLERAGMRTVAFCEIDPYCRRVLAKHWPDVPVYGDIRTLTAKVLADAARLGCKRGGNDEGARGNGWDASASRAGIDVICGGFPCQDISIAGKGAGMAGARSGLWSEYARLVGELRPRYVIVENVAALLGRGLERVLGDLAALGYDADWNCIPASAVGAPHRRDRVWIVAYPGCGNGGTWQRTASGSDQSGTDIHAQRCSAFAGILGTARRHEAILGLPGEQGLPLGQGPAGERPHATTGGTGWWDIEPDVLRVADGISPRLYGDMNGRQINAAQTREDISQELLRELWFSGNAWRSSQGQGTDEQLARELADALPSLPHALALGGRQDALAAASRFLHRMRQACKAIGAVRDASDPIAQAWQSLSEEEAERTFLAACGRTDWASGEWLGVDRVARNIPARVDRIRSLGNAVVPQIPEIIGRAILARSDVAATAKTPEGGTVSSKAWMRDAAGNKRWFRMYAEVLDDPKVQRLPAKLFKTWVNILCVASRYGGEIPVADLPHQLGRRKDFVEREASMLVKCGLLVTGGGLIIPHNWFGRQYRSDASTDRVRQFRLRKMKRFRNVPSETHETAPDKKESKKERERRWLSEAGMSREAETSPDRIENLKNLEPLDPKTWRQ